MVINIRTQNPFYTEQQKRHLQKTINVLAYPRHGIPSDLVVQLKKEVSK
jgi:hypothetical protein